MFALFCNLAVKIILSLAAGFRGRVIKFINNQEAKRQKTPVKRAVWRQAGRFWTLAHLNKTPRVFLATNHNLSSHA